jgi:hypothetical protein
VSRQEHGLDSVQDAGVDFFVQRGAGCLRVKRRVITAMSAQFRWASECDGASWKSPGPLGVFGKPAQLISPPFA